jgi:hypothetical protein
MSKLAKDTSASVCADGVLSLGFNVNAIEIAEALIHQYGS